MAEPNAPAPQWTIERLGKHHDRDGFDCGEPSLNNWFARSVSQYEKRGQARTYVAVRPGVARVLGFYAICSHHVRYELLPSEQARGLPRHVDVPVVLLGRLAVDRNAQGQKLGGLLLIDALRRTLYLAEDLGIQAIEVDALNDQASAFYKHHGFVPLADDTRHLYLSLHVVRKLNLPPLLS